MMWFRKLRIKVREFIVIVYIWEGRVGIFGKWDENEVKYFKYN